MDHTPETRRLIRALATLGSQQMFPVMLAALRSSSFTVERMEKLLRYLVTLTVRYQTIGKGRTGRLEIAGAHAALGIATGKLKSPFAVWGEFGSLIPPEEDFRTEFSRFVETKPARARFLLSELERVAFRRQEDRDSDLTPWEGLTLEHVFPQNPSGEWQAELAGSPDLREQTNRLGNLCLLNGPRNKILGSKGFDKKKTGLFAGSDLLLTKEIAAFDTWGSAAIEQRQEQLADLATEAWPLPSA